MYMYAYVSIKEKKLKPRLIIEEKLTRSGNKQLQTICLPVHAQIKLKRKSQQILALGNQYSNKIMSTFLLSLYSEM